MTNPQLPPSKLEEFLNVKNKQDREPALRTGLSIGTVAGILSLVNFFFPELLNDRQNTLILVFAAFMLPLVTAIFTRGKVWSPDTVEQIIEEATEEAIHIKEEKNKRP